MAGLVVLGVPITQEVVVQEEIVRVEIEQLRNLAHLENLVAEMVVVVGQLGMGLVIQQI